MSDTLQDIPLTRIDGTSATLRDYAGKVVLVVNVASKCGLTPQYEGLESLYREFRGRGLEVVGFPTNDFGEQEPGSEKEISDFCTSVYGVEFPMFSKIAVTGEDKHPLYKELIAAKPVAEFKEGSGILSYQLKHHPETASSPEVHWNFEKFLIDRSGNVVRRFGPDTEPRANAIVEAIEEALGVGA
ncbi:MAG: glutathione peroxidase [Phycisphaerae bacterium]|nr:glutathione peroxidase [Gemmatimonadaceae bacterium]